MNSSNPALELARITNSKGYCIDTYANKLLKDNGISLAQIISEMHEDGWILREFFNDEHYRTAFGNQMRELRTIPEDAYSSNDSQRIEEELKMHYPVFYALVPWLVTLNISFPER